MTVAQCTGCLNLLYCQGPSARGSAVRLICAALCPDPQAASAAFPIAFGQWCLSFVIDSLILLHILRGSLLS